jgi:hypothetical protein
MYLQLGQDTVIRTENILGIFDLDNTTVQKSTRDYLNSAEKSGETVYVSFDLPKSFVVAERGGSRQVYITHLATNTLFKRK